MVDLTQESGPAPKAGKGWSISLWLAQLLVGLPFIMFGAMKISMPIEELAKMMPWAGQYPLLLRITGVVDLAGGLGMILPALTRIQPRLTVLAALGCTVLQILAIGFHVSRGEGALTPLNGVFLAASIFVLWGRSRRAPIRPRR